MILVVGGSHAGKTEYVMCRFGITNDEIAVGILDDRLVVSNLEVLIGSHPEWDEALPSMLLQKTAILCQEIGCGIVPIDPEERAYRERVGRICIRLAEQADEVIRVCCGIPTIWKGREDE